MRRKSNFAKLAREPDGSLPVSSLSQTDLIVIASALNHAICDRDSLAGAYRYKGEEAERALEWCKRYEALHQKIFGAPTGEKQNRDRLAKAGRVSIFELKDET